MSNIKDITDACSMTKIIKKKASKAKNTNLTPSSTFFNASHKEDSSNPTEDYINHNKQTQELYDTISSNEKEIEFLNKVISQVLDINELMKIKQNSHYDENTHT